MGLKSIFKGADAGLHVKAVLTLSGRSTAAQRHHALQWKRDDQAVSLRPCREEGLDFSDSIYGLDDGVAGNAFAGAVWAGEDEAVERGGHDFLYPGFFDGGERVEKNEFGSVRCASDDKVVGKVCALDGCGAQTVRTGPLPRFTF